jgi:hypothetical protein
LFIKVAETAKLSTNIFGAKAIFIDSKQKDNRQPKNIQRSCQMQNNYFYSITLILSCQEFMTKLF